MSIFFPPASPGSVVGVGDGASHAGWGGLCSCGRSAEVDVPCSPPQAPSARGLAALLWEDGGFIWPGRGALGGLCALWCLAQSWDRISEMCPALDLCSPWSVCPTRWLGNERSFAGELCPPSEKPCTWDAALADVGQGLGTPTLEHGNSSARPAAMLRAFLG